MSNKDFKVKNGLTVTESLSVGAGANVVGLSASSTRNGFVSAGRDLADIFGGSGSGTIEGVTAGSGLSGGGTSGTVTLTVGRGDGVTITDNTVAVDSTVVRTSGNQTIAGCKTFSDNTTITGNLSVTGDITCIDTTISTTSALSVVNAGTGPALFVQQDGSQPIAHFVDKNGDDIFFNDNGTIQTPYLSAGRNTCFGNCVGIGTNSPDYTLDVAGDIGVDQYIYHNGDPNTYLNFTDDRLRFNIGGISYIDLNDAGAQPHDITFNDGGNNVDVTIKGTGANEGNPLLKTDASTNRVGINGIGAPEAELEVDGTILATGSDPHIGIGTTSPGEALTVSGNISSNGSLSASGSGFNYLEGRLGINTNRPDYMLDVAGSVGIGACLIHNGDDDTFISFSDDDINIQAGGVNFIDITQDTNNEITFNETGADIDFRAEGDSDTHLLFVDAGNDKIGIGTAAPGEKLTVGGSISSNGHFTTESLSVSSTNNGILSAGRDLADIFATSAGNVDGSGTADTVTLWADSNTICSSPVTKTELGCLDGLAATTAELNCLDGLTATTAELNCLDGLTSQTCELNCLDGLNSTTAELNTLDGFTGDKDDLNYAKDLKATGVTTTEFNCLDGLTSQTCELNCLDGLNSTTTELNCLDGLTATTAELNRVDGVTENVQLQTAQLSSISVKTIGESSQTIAGDLSSNGHFTTESLSVSSTNNGILSAGRDLADIFATSAGNITGVTAGTGLSGGGTNGDVTLDIGRGDGITLTNNAVAVDGTVLRTTGAEATGLSATSTLNGIVSAGRDLDTIFQTVITGAASTITDSNVTGDRAVISNGDGKIAVSNVTATELGCLDGLTSQTCELNCLDGLNSTTAELNTLDGFTGDKDDLNYAKDLKATGVTTTEFDCLDGLTSQTCELNCLDGLNSTTAELNCLDGLTATTAELNYSDGVTSNIQTQLDNTVHLTGKASQAVTSKLSATELYSGSVSVSSTNGGIISAGRDLADIFATTSGNVDGEGTADTVTLWADSNTICSSPVTKTELGCLDGLAATTAELNCLDGLTATTAELNTLDGFNGDVSVLNYAKTLCDTGVTGTEFNCLDGLTSQTCELNCLDGLNSTTAELNCLDGLTATTAELNRVDGVTENIQLAVAQLSSIKQDCITLTASRALVSNGSGKVGVSGVTSTELGCLDGLTSTTAELNTLDGFTGDKDDLNYAKDLKATGVTTTEFDCLDGLAATTAELNCLDGLTSTTAELNCLDGLTATTAELNFSDGVTSNIQDQIDATVKTTGNQTVAGCKTFTGNTTITGNLSVTGDITCIDTVFSVTSALSVVNEGTGPALVVQQNGSEPIAHFIDKNGDDIFFNDNGTIQTPYLSSGRNTCFTNCIFVCGDVDVNGNLETDAISINGTTVSSTAAELNCLDGLTSTTAELNTLDGFTGDKDDLNYAKDLKATGVTTTEFNCLDGLSSTTAELNTLDGFNGDVSVLNYAKTLCDTGVTGTEFNCLDGLTSQTCELNCLDGLNSTTAELNCLDGLTSTTAELNCLDGLTSTTAELNYSDGVTSNIQTQLDNKVQLTGKVSQAITSKLSANELYSRSVSVSSTNGGIISAGRDLADIFAISAGNITGVTAGTGLSGGGTEGDVTIDIGRGDGITLTNDAIAVNDTVLRTTGNQSIGGEKTFTDDISIAGKIIHNGDTDTFINLTDDDINIQAGGVNFIDITQDTSNEITFNEGGADIDFRAEGSSNTHLLFVNAGNNRVGIGTDDPDYKLDVAGSMGINEYIYHNGDGDTYLRFAPNEVNLVAGGKSAIKYVAADGKIILNNTNENVDVHIMAEDNTELLATDAANNKVGINTTTPNEALTVIGNISSNGHFSTESLNVSSTNGGILSAGRDLADIFAQGGTAVDGSGSADTVTLWADSNTLCNSVVTKTELGCLDGLTATTAELNCLDGLTSTTAELNTLDGFNGDVNDLNYAKTLCDTGVTGTEFNCLDGLTSQTCELNCLDGLNSTTTELNCLDGLTSTTAELNCLDGLTSTTAELNCLDGLTSTTAELNCLDGLTSTTAELNCLDGLTATTAELNRVDGVTENLQLQTAQLSSIKQDCITLTASRALVSNGSGKVTASSITSTELGCLDGLTSTTAELNTLDGFNGDVNDLNYAKTLCDTGVTGTEFNCLDGLTSTTAELNTLDGFTGDKDDLNYAKDLKATGVTTTEFNCLDGLTSTTAELNCLDGLTSTTAELNCLDGLTATTTELNYVDGVTSSIQTQLNGTVKTTGDQTIAGVKTFSNNVNVEGNLSVTGDITCIETIYSITSALSVTNTGTGPALFVKQDGSQPIAHFIDKNGDDILFADDGKICIGNSKLVLNGTTVSSTAAELNCLDGLTSTTTELNCLDGLTSTTTELNCLDGLTSTTAELNCLDGLTSTTAELNCLDGLTSTTAELNTLDGFNGDVNDLNYAKTLCDTGVTGTEFNCLDGLTSQTCELNCLDGLTSTTAELNCLDGLTATTAELNRVDGVTENLQLQTAQLSSIKQDCITLTASRALVSTGAGKVTASSITSTELGCLDGLTSTTAELNTLDGFNGDVNDLNYAKTLCDTGVTGTEFNCLDGLTSTTAELNCLDGLTSTTAELNTLDGFNGDVDDLNYAKTLCDTGVTGTEFNCLDGLTSTTTELNCLDGLVSTTLELNRISGFTGNATDLNYAATLLATGVTGTEFNCLDGLTSTTAELNCLDGLTSTTAELNCLDGLTSTTAELNTLDGFTGDVNDLNYAKDLKATGVTDTEFNCLDGLTSTTSELNCLDGLTSTTAELNCLDGLTSTTAELNCLDGLTATTTELNYVDGVTSSIQTQLNGTVKTTGAQTVAGTKNFSGNICVGGSISHTGDSDTKLDFALADNIFLCTGNEQRIHASNSGVVINDVGASTDLRVEGNTDENLLFVDGSADKVGIGTSSPGEKLTVSGNLSSNGHITTESISVSSTDGGILSAGRDLADIFAQGSSAIDGSGTANRVVAWCDTNTIGASNVTTTELNCLDGLTSTTAELNKLDGFNGGVNDLNYAKTLCDTGVTGTEFNCLDGLTATTSELNKLDGVTATTSELNCVDGLTATTSELNCLDGLTSTTAELNCLDGLTSTTAELNCLDGLTSTTAELNTLDGFTGDVNDLNYAKDLKATGVTTTEFDCLDGLTSTTTELNKLDGVTSQTCELNCVDGLTSTTAELNTLDGFTGDVNDLNYAKDLKATGVTTTEFNCLDGLTSTTTELNKLDGVTATTSELNCVDGLTATTSELNKLDGVTSSTAELNCVDGLTSTTAELNLLDGSSANTVVNSKAAIYGSSGELAGTLSTAAQTNITSLGTLTTLTVDDITLNGSTISDSGALTISSGDDVIIDAESDINLDANGADIRFKDNGSIIGAFQNSSSNFVIKSGQNNKDIIFCGVDNSTDIAALTLDMSDAGSATFNNDVTVQGDLTVTGDFTCKDTIVTVTSALSVTNTGTGPALFVRQDGTQPIAHFIDKNGDDILFADDGKICIGNSKLVLNGTAVTSTAAELNKLDGVTSTATELNCVDGLTATTAELNCLDGLTSTTAELNTLDGFNGDVNDLNYAKTLCDTGVTGTEFNCLDGLTSQTCELNCLDGLNSTTTELNCLDGLTSTTAELNTLDGFNGDVNDLNYAKTLCDTGVTGTEFNCLDGLTATTSELNKLDGVTATTSELNCVDGLTATTSELNKLDGVTATASELNCVDGLTSTTAELNTLDGFNGDVNDLNYAKTLCDTGVTGTEFNCLDGLTATTSELNKLDGVTSSTAELNCVDGLTATTSELNCLDGLTSTTSELNLLDGITAGTVSASKAVIVDSNKDITGFRNFTNTGCMTVCGHLQACSKAFVIDHPTKPGKKLRHGAVEAPEWSVHYRGITDNDCIDLPDYWDGLVRKDSVTTMLTPLEKQQDLYVVSQDNDYVCVGGVTGCYNYIVYGERKDIDKLEVETDGDTS